MRVAPTMAGACAALLICLTVAAAGAQERSSKEKQQPGPLFPVPHLGPIPDPELPRGMADFSSESCAGCHREIHDQWAGSGHADAFTNELFQWAWTEADRPNSCLDCHAPLASQRSDLPTMYVGDDPEKERSEPNPGYRPLLRNEGVGCAICHLRDGTVYGPREVAEGASPHPVTKHEGLRRPETICAPCHQRIIPGTEDKALYNTFAEWASSPYAKVGIPCQDCHMPLVAGEIAAGRFDTYPSHHLPGRDAPHIAHALNLDLKLSQPWFNRGDDGEAVLTVTNRGAGHAVPTGDPFHRLQLLMRVSGPDGLKKTETEYWFARDIQRKPPWKEKSDTRLMPGQSVEIRVPIKSKANMDPGQGRVEIELWYHKVPPKEMPEGLEESQAPKLIRSETVQVELR